MGKIRLEKINKKYPNSDKYAVVDFNLEIEDGEFIVLVGPSGCGKSTTLRMIAGLEDISGDEFYIDDKLVNNASSKERDIAMVFQSYALYPHMNVRDNIGYGLKLRHEPKEKITQKVEKIANDLGLSEYLERKPKALSGGQRQRVALGRTMVRKPRIYLMDEPLSNLDAKLRTSTRAEISRLHRKRKTTTIYVTHDQVEAMTMADRIVLMSMGEVQQIGTPKDLFINPCNKFVATFMGMPPMNIISGYYSDGYFQCATFKIKVSQSDEKILARNNYQNKKIYLGVRASAIKLGNIFEETYPESIIDVKVDNIEYLGDHLNVFFEAEPGNVFVSNIVTTSDIKVDNIIRLVIENSKLYFFDIDNEKSIKYNDKLT